MNNFLEKLYGLDKSHKDKALDLLFDTVDEFCSDGRFGVVDNLLQNVEVGRCSLTLLVGFLSITLFAKDELPSRPDFYDRVFVVAEKIKGKKRAEKMLKGLE